MKDKKDIAKENCQHEIWQECGHWIGKDIKTKERIGGPVARCMKCGKLENFTWNQWKKCQAPYQMV